MSTLEKTPTQKPFRKQDRHSRGERQGRRHREYSDVDVYKEQHDKRADDYWVKTEVESGLAEHYAESGRARLLGQAADRLLLEAGSSNLLEAGDKEDQDEDEGRDTSYLNTNSPYSLPSTFNHPYEGNQTITELGVESGPEIKRRMAREALIDGYSDEDDGSNDRALHMNVRNK